MAYGHLPRLVHSGPVGASTTWREWDIAPTGVLRIGPRAWIYHLFDTDGSPLYVGKAWRPQPRFQSHSRKPWWPDVAHLNLYALTCESHPGELCRDINRTALIWERHAIANMAPRFNIAHMPRVS